MADYANSLNESSCRSIYDIINWCHESLPERYRYCPWNHPDLNRGVALLESDDALNCYMSAYGDMHTSKCRAAMMNFPFNELVGSIEIVDWGCGQGVGSATIIDILGQRNLLQWVKKVTLIEPSKQALNRATSNLLKLTQNGIQVEAINRYMPSNNCSSEDVMTPVGYRYANIIHIFSNILDVQEIDLASVAHFVASSHGKHFILCIGPKNAASYRIEQFCSIFGSQHFFSKIDSVRYGRTKRTGHPYTCMTRCFVYDGSPLDLDRMSLYQGSGEDVYNDYDLRLQIQNKVLSIQKARVAYRLQNILSLDDIIYVDPVINEVQVDFIIVRPNKGVLLVNLFEKNLENCSLTEDGKGIKTGDNKVYQSPIDLISLCQASIKDGIEELLMSTIENRQNFSLIKKVVVFTENSIQSVKSFFGIPEDRKEYTHLFGEEFIKDKTVSQSLYTKINFFYNNPNFDDVVKRKLASILSPSWHSYQEGRIGMEPKGAQKGLVISHSTQQKISGVAGSGKTFVLATRAINAMKRTGGNVLILTYNKTLPNYIRYRLSEIREDFSWEKIDIYYYHHFFRIRASECQLHVEFDSYEDTDFFIDEDNYKRYSAIFVDEVQDYTTPWLKILLQYFLEPNGEFVVIGDSKQNVYDRPEDVNGDIKLGVIGGVWNRELNTCQRFANPRLASLAMSFQSEFYPPSHKDFIKTGIASEYSLNFQIISYCDMRNNNILESLVPKIIEIIKEDNNDAKDFVVIGSSIKTLRMIDDKYRSITGEQTEVTFVTTEKLEWLKEHHNVSNENTASWRFRRDYDSIERSKKMLFTSDKRFLKISTIQSFKGWESPSVIFILEDEISPKFVYTAITRAREHLYIINIGNDKYDNFFKTQSL